jgi:hypothetical protein
MKTRNSELIESFDVWRPRWGLAEVFGVIETALRAHFAKQISG